MDALTLVHVLNDTGNFFPYDWYWPIQNISDLTWPDS